MSMKFKEIATVEVNVTIQIILKEVLKVDNSSNLVYSSLVDSQLFCLYMFKHVIHLRTNIMPISVNPLCKFSC